MSHISYEEWEPVIGLEIHVQLKTRSKLFARSPNRFGDEPNTNIDVIDTGQPGALPVLNQEAVDKAILFGCAIGAEVATFSKFDRKSYFYPDSPRNFQITQFDKPIIIGGKVLADVEGKSKEFQIHHAHLEDDAGMLKHFSEFAGVDYNRAGVPLLEIVSEPCMFSPKDASAYAMAIKAIMQYLDVSDCNMEEGSLRIDTNISVRPRGDKTLRNKVEVKNMNSFTNMEMAIEAEIRRQVRAYTAHPHENPANVIKSETVRFDLEKKETVVMRSKEEAKDYRYFPEPDLPPIVLKKEYIEKIRREMPELPHERFDRYVNKLKLSDYNASILVNEKALSDYFEEALKSCNNASALCNWITVEFVGRLKDSGTPLYQSPILPRHIAALVNFIDQKKITGRIAKDVADIMVQIQGKDPELIIRENPNFQAVHDTSAIEPFVDQVLSENAQSVEDFKAGKDKAFNFLVGQVMKLSKGKASPDVVKDLLTKKILP
ncbi:MAG: Asp-tRNA(Asn)/Glu-tRNA(Gln) amidotransferase subunit GatB [Simkania sp.]|nr:Asp-tRNA(Asn)/Glu-tRNA(Gln) amidotransferase subunit GatB [Simkania sp.]MCB1075263.1 Asp-tRNA(Asn)/Glu-tRNA(Gln) amidotransferase subunit GatB [Simkania sp.]